MMSYVKLAFLLTVLGFSFAHCQQTSDVTTYYGLALHGATKYGKGFHHFDYVNRSAPPGGTIRIGVLGTFDTLNPFIVRGVSAEAQNILVFERLMDRSGDEPFSIYGRVAESAEMPADKSWIAFNIRPEARFHDGSPILATDIDFSHDLLMRKGRPHMRLFYSKISKKEILSPHKIKFYFKDNSDRELPLLIGYMPVLSKKYYTDHDFERASMTEPVGSGPYKVQSVKPGRQIVYERDPKYWGNHLPFATGQYNFQTVVYDYFRDDTSAFESFKAGAYDIWEETDIARWLNQYNFPAVKRGDVMMSRIPPRRSVGMYGFVFNTRRPIFKDRIVREALNLSFDADWVNKTYFHGDYVQISSYFAGTELSAPEKPSVLEMGLMRKLQDLLPSGLFKNVETATVDDPTFNPFRSGLNRAIAMLERAGWVVRNNKLVNSQTGEPMTFEILIVYPSHERLALAYKKNLQRLGIDVKVRKVEASGYEQRLQNFDYDMIIHRWEQTRTPGQEQHYYWGTKAAQQMGSRNYAGVNVPGVDKVIDEMTKTGDREEFVAYARILDRVLKYGHYVVPLFQLKNDLIAHQNRFGKPSICPSDGFAMPRWWTMLTWWETRPIR